ncbi:MAG: site-specific integrase [Fusobacteriaceae bacterium]|jgi:integrase|nr:site-specific integrase [Fusobacteriaceae bacterium]
MRKKILFKNWGEEWLDKKRLYIKESTFFLYNTNIRKHLTEYFGNYYIDEITNEMLHLFLKKLIKNGASSGTIKNIITLLKSILRTAIDRNLINNQNFKINSPINKEIKQLSILSISEQKNLMKAILENLNYKTLGIIVCLNTGVRVGELCALQWKDIDLKNKVISITKTIQRISCDGVSRVIITTPKTKTSIREIPISTWLRKFLKQFHNKNGDIYLISNNTKPMEPRIYRRCFYKFLHDNKMENIKMHTLRHTFATTCIISGSEYKTVSTILGHSNINTTLNLYVHPRMDDKRKCIENITFILK